MECTDVNNLSIKNGHLYVPGPKSCTLCVCENGSPTNCKPVLCTPPQNCNSFSRIGDSCCDFICTDDTLGKSDVEHDFNAEVGLRLMAAAITAILSLSLLFFLLHRLRQRKIRGRQDRELTEEERSLGSIAYITGSLGYIPEHHFEETGAGYPIWKPSYYSRGEAPPPYEEALAASRADAALARIPGPSITSQMQTQHRTIPVNIANSGSYLGSSSPLPDEAVTPLLEPPPPLLNEELDSSEILGNSGTVTSSTEEKQGEAGLNLNHLETVLDSEVKTAAVIEPKGREGTGADESDDYRSECENCNMRQSPGYEEDLVTMTLHRRTGETFDQQFYNRASLTLPTHPRKQQRCVNGIQSSVMSCARDNWFNSMRESSTSEDEEEE